MPVTIHFLPDDVTITAEAGESLIGVARRAGLDIPTGCLMGSCHACEVEVNGEAVCSCISSVPNCDHVLTVELYGDPSW
jgi:ferredoxin